MKQMLSTAAVAFAFAVAVSAQTTPQSQPQSQTQPGTSSTAPHKSEKAHKKMSTPSTVTLTGCLRQGDTPNTFELDNARMAGSDMSSMHGEQQGTKPETSTQTSASSTTGSGTSAGMSGGEVGTVKLLATADIDLKDHVGHRVEVRGTMSDKQAGMAMTKDKGSSSTSDTMGSGSSASSTSATGTSGGTKESPDKNAHTLRVRAFRHISDTCSQ